jgi:hypothetical protein
MEAWNELRFMQAIEASVCGCLLSPAEKISPQ